MKVKAIIGCLVFLILLLLFFGCKRPKQETPGIGSAGKPYKIAILIVSDMYLPLSVEGLKQGMQELGYREGEDIEYTVYNAKGDATKLESLVGQALQTNPHVLCPSTVTAVNAVKATGTKIPVVFLESMYPVEFGLVKSLTKPGTNYTGVSNMTGPMSGKRLELLQKMCPKIKKIAVLCNPANKVAALSLEKTKAAAADLGLQLDIHLFADQVELDAAIAKLRSSPIDALALNPDFMVFARLPELIELAKKKKIPTMGIDSVQVEQGILASYGGGLKEIAGQAARQLDRVLRGESPATIPIEAPRKYRLYLNMKTAAEIGATLPEEILYQAEGYYK